MIDYPLVIGMALEQHRDRLREAEQAQLVRLALAGKSKTQDAHTARPRTSWWSAVAAMAAHRNRLGSVERNSNFSPATK